MKSFVRPDSLRLSLLFGVALVLGGCAHLGPGLAGTPCPVEWVSSDSIDSVEGALRARMQLQIRDESIHLEIIAESRDDELVVVGLARFGVRLFAVHQNGTTITVEGASTGDLEQVAIWMMDAMHRVFWIDSPDDVGLAAEERWVRGDEEVTESRSRGVRRREFTLSGAPGAPGAASEAATRRVTIDYLESVSDEAPSSPADAATISIRNPWCGYDAVIVPVRASVTTTR